MTEKPKASPTPSLARQIVSLRSMGRWAELAGLVKDHRDIAEKTVATFRAQSDEDWIRCVNRFSFMGFRPRSLPPDARNRIAEELKTEVERLDTAAAVSRSLPMDRPDLPALMVLWLDELLATAIARTTVHRISTPVDGSASKYKIRYRQFDRGTKMNVYEPVDIVMAEGGHYRDVPRTSLPPEVRDAFFWYRDNMIVKSVRIEDSHARSLNEQVDEGYHAASYCLGRHPSFVNTTVFRHRDSCSAVDQPSGISLIIEEARPSGSGEIRPVYIGQEGMVVVVQRRAPTSHIQSIFEMLRRNADENLQAHRQELKSADTFFRRLTRAGRARIENIRQNIRKIEEDMIEEKQFIVGELYKPFKEFMANTYGVADLDPDFERNYSLKFKEGPDKNLRSAISHVVSFDFDQFRTIRAFERQSGRLPDAFEFDAPAAIVDGILQSQLKALAWI